MVKLASGLVAAGIVAACSDPPNKVAACEMQPTTNVSAVTIEDRKIIGAAAPYSPDLGMVAKESELETSAVSRRQTAWQVIERVLSPVPVGEQKLGQQLGQQPTIPRWHSWYGKDDFERVFKKLYKDLGSTGRQARQPFQPATIAAGLEWNANALDELRNTSWPEQRYLEYLAAADSEQKARGFAGISRVSYSPGALSHLLASYQTMLACRDTEPAAFVDEDVAEGRAVTNTQALELASCEFKVLGPFVTASDAEFAARSTGSGDADLYLRRGSAPDFDNYDCKAERGDSAETCKVPGGGPIYVGVFAAKESTVNLAVEYREADVRKPTCLTTEFPRDAVLIKADWRRAQFGEQLPIFDTSGPRMAARLSKAGNFDWGPGDGQSDPGPNDIYTVTTPSGAIFRLAGLHIMTKELDHWVWITLWWSTKPNLDFGADRPASVANLPGPWRNYKMCVATSYIEGDADPTGGASDSLGAALAATHRGEFGPSWCSNPYIETGHLNANTNCIGCHQHGGTKLAPESILTDFPAMGSTRVRNNFFTDYLWAIRGGRGEDLTEAIKAEVDFWDAGN